MQAKRMLASSNIPVELQAAFILGALTCGSLVEILAYYGPEGPPVDINPVNLWVVLSRVFTYVELGPDRDNRFAQSSWRTLATSDYFKSSLIARLDYAPRHLMRIFVVLH